MSGKSTSRKPAFSGDRATLPPIIEDTSESAWDKFQAMQDVQGHHYLPTVPPDAADQAQKPAPAGPLDNPGLDDVLALARSKNRACPMPPAWWALHKLLPVRTKNGQRVAAPEPLDGPAWFKSSSMDKRLRLRDQITWAAGSGALIAVYDHLVSLEEDQWHHF